jgi:hypothetical protein
MNVVERAIQNHERRIDSLERSARSLTQRSHQGGGIMGSGGGGGGTYFCDPDGEVIDPGGNKTLQVHEILLAGPQDRGNQPIINPFLHATNPDARLILSKNSDGSFSVINQGCPVP